MTVIDKFRAATQTEDAQGEQVRRREVSAGLAGATTALGGLAVFALLALVGGLMVPRADAGFGASIGSGAALWLLAGGARLALGEAVIAFTPLFGALALVLVARGVARRTLSEDDDWRTIGAWYGGYAGVGATAWLLALASPVTPVAWSMTLPVLVLPALALLSSGQLPLGTLRWWDQAPLGLKRALLPGAKGALGAVIVSMMILVAVAAWNFERIGHVQTSLAPGFAGGLVLTLLQILYLPNLGLWVLSVAAGPGMSMTEGATTTWSGAEAGVLPMVPIFAAHPDTGKFPWFVVLLVLIPVAIGAWVALTALRSVSRLASTQTKLSTVAWALVVMALAITVLDLLGGGSLGTRRLAEIGAPAGALGLAILGEAAIGGLIVLARDWWQLRR